VPWVEAQVGHRFGHTLSVKLFDGGLGNIHQASSLGCFIVHVVPLGRSLNPKTGDRYAL